MAEEKQRCAVDEKQQAPCEPGKKLGCRRGKCVLHGQVSGRGPRRSGGGGGSRPAYFPRTEVLTKSFDPPPRSSPETAMRSQTRKLPWHDPKLPWTRKEPSTGPQERPAHVSVSYSVPEGLEAQEPEARLQRNPEGTGALLQTSAHGNGEVFIHVQEDSGGTETHVQFGAHDDLAVVQPLQEERIHTPETLRGTACDAYGGGFDDEEFDRDPLGYLDSFGPADPSDPYSEPNNEVMP